ncbi:MAG: FHA domain-containing protein [Leptolyngbyaceae cyanobacterium bins.59]|nr:FHA domain-containing protein [Leptolyngbyaceae cyanobacterium bins.59]
MINPLSAEYSSYLLNASPEQELEKRLGLYQVFIKLYEHNRELLEEILDLENSSRGSLAKNPSCYIQGLVNKGQVLLITNLGGDKSRAIVQPDKVWTIGRSQHATVSINDKRISRLHGAIHYIEGQGFYLIDMGSTNGSFVNGEPVNSHVLLQNGDQVRLSSLAFTFYHCQTIQVAKAVSPQVISNLKSKLISAYSDLDAKIDSLAETLELMGDPTPLPAEPEETFHFLRSELLNE